ncbi:MAG: hypothetical protein F9K40_21400 [Kofleriaceae bacterium]|nr:MAG: hypothetical protein F9K40_21400 [Kofleriaceae bacterium]
MEYPYDAGLEPDTLALLAAFRGGSASAEPDERMAALSRDDMPADLKAWLHTYAHHGGLVSIGDVWFEADNAQLLRNVVEAFGPDDADLEHDGVDGLDLERAVVMGNTADGEVFFAAAWKPGDARLTMVKFCCAGYKDDGYHALGSFFAALQGIAEKVEDLEDIDEPVRTVLARDRKA